jgi:hypothetical protein
MTPLIVLMQGLLPNFMDASAPLAVIGTLLPNCLIFNSLRSAWRIRIAKEEPGEMSCKSSKTF